MNLNDILLTYNLVKVPNIDKTQENIPYPNPVNSRMDRLVQYINSKKEDDLTKDLLTKELLVEETQGFPGWTLSTVNDQNNNNNIYTDNPSGLIDFDTAYQKAIQKEQSVTIRLNQFKNTEKLKNFEQNLNAFYLTPEGKLYNPDNATNENLKKLLTDLKDIVYSIAALESGFNHRAINKANEKNNAFGYFLFIQSTLSKNYNITNYEDFRNNPNQQFRVAFKHLMSMMKEVNNGVNSGIYNRKNWTPLQIIYGMWWRPLSMKALLKVNPTDNDIKNINIDVHGMNLATILARARTN